MTCTHILWLDLRTQQVLKMEGEELAKHGPAKLPEKQGLDEYSETPVQKGEFYVSDPTGRRTGNGECVCVCVCAEGQVLRV